jgi:hypothetical protein
MTNSDDGEELVLSSAAQAALAEFLAEKQAQESGALSSSNVQDISIDDFPEDWQVKYGKLRTVWLIVAVAILVRQ